MERTHARWLSHCADQLGDALVARPDGALPEYALLVHQVVQAQPADLREFVLAYSRDGGRRFPSLMALAWRIVGNEFREELADRASDEILRLLDIDEWENAVSAFSSGRGARPFRVPRDGGGW